jgi:fibrillarin-like pre-rRNA processing protein
MRQSKIFEVYEEGRSIFTRSVAPGTRVYGETILRDGKAEYREWDPRRSKLGAAIVKGCPNVGIRKGDCVLYLGSATGTTVSHVSDMVGKEGFVFALDFAPRVMRDLVIVATERPNIAPVLADANRPETYASRIMQPDIIFQDIAQKSQVEIFLKNVRMFLKKEGYALLSVKSRSIDVTKKPKQVFREVKETLERELIIFDYRELSPFEKDHCIFICKKK